MTVRIASALRNVGSTVVILLASLLVAACLGAVARATAATSDAAVDPSMRLATPRPRPARRRRRAGEGVLVGDAAGGHRVLLSFSAGVAGCARNVGL